MVIFFNFIKIGFGRVPLEEFHQFSGARDRSTILVNQIYD